MNILFLEDNPAAISLLVDRVKEIDPEGRVFVCRRLEDATRQLREQRIDLAIIDLYVPGDLGSLQDYVKPGEETHLRQGQFFSRHCREKGVDFLVYSNVRQIWLPDEGVNEEKTLFDKSPEGTKKIMQRIEEILGHTNG